MSMIKTLYGEPDDRGRITKVMTCQCGETHSSDCYFDDFDCRCGRMYNIFGQELENRFGDGETEPYFEDGEFLATARTTRGRV